MTNKTVNFSDGEALEHTDLNALQTLSLGRAIDTQQYSQAFSNFIAPSAAPWIAAADWGVANGVKDRAWTRGPTDCIQFRSNVLQISVSPGVIGVWDSTLPPASDHLFKWVHLSTDTVVTHSTGAALVTGRYDLVTIQVTDATSDSASRDFKDATTGALSTQSFDKRRTYSVNFQVTEGLDAGPPPNVPAGRIPLYSIFIGPGAVDVVDSNIRDWTMPLGKVDSFITRGVDSVYDSTGWQVNNGTGRIEGAAGTGVAVALPLRANGSPYARLLGWESVGDYGATGCDISLVRALVSSGAWSAPTSLVNYGVTTGQATVKQTYGTQYSASASQIPIWGSGAFNRIRPVVHNMVGVEFAPQAIEVKSLQTVRWWFLAT